MLRAVFIATCLALASPSVAQQVRVITGDIEHIYGPGGEVLDDAELRARNERAFERMQLEKQRAIEMQQIEAENERLRLLRDQTALAYAATPTWDSRYGGWFFVGRHRGPPGETRRLA
jgi:hypothetical protein